VDSLDMHREWLETPPAQGGLGPLQFPLASDPEGAAARAYGVWDAGKGVSTRGLFVIDPDGVLQYSVVHNLSVGRSTEEVLRVVDALQTGGLCPASWTRADGTLDPEAALQPGRVLGHYRIRRPLGTGSFGNVFDAWDLRLERPVALKVLKRYGSESRDVLLNEARAAARLNHPHVCTVYAVEEEDGLPVIVMELLEGRSLSALIAAGLVSDAVAALARQIASGLAEAHRSEIVHGDLKPANVIVTHDRRAKILDFGLAAARGRPVVPAPGSVPTPAPVPVPSSDEAGATQIVAPPAGAGAVSSGTVAGTPAYMSPEQARGEPATPASDVYAFGLTLYEMVTGRRALDTESAVEVVLRLRSGDVAAEVGPELSPPYRELVTAALAREAARRPSMAEVGEWLARIGG
jgi:serine/threonine protein kinase